MYILVIYTSSMMMMMMMRMILTWQVAVHLVQTLVPNYAVVMPSCSYCCYYCLVVSYSWTYCCCYLYFDCYPILNLILIQLVLLPTYHSYSSHSYYDQDY